MEFAGGYIKQCYIQDTLSEYTKAFERYANEPKGPLGTCRVLARFRFDGVRAIWKVSKEKKAAQPKDRKYLDFELFPPAGAQAAAAPSGTGVWPVACSTRLAAGQLGGAPAPPEAARFE